MSADEAYALADPDAVERHPFWSEKWFSDEACCELVAQAKEQNWSLGSHYHCPRCWAETGMYGHYTSIHVEKGKPVKVEGHTHCPDWCELSGAPDPVAAPSSGGQQPQDGNDG